MHTFSSSLRSSLISTSRPALSQSKRLFRTSVTPVDLRYDALHPPDVSKGEMPLVILHGLFGMKRNWLSLSKAFLRDLQRPVYTLDLRNHGSSPHASPMNYEAMAADVIHFFRERSLSNVSLLGHSMGGKVAMAVALSPQLPENVVDHLIVADIAPSAAALSSEFQGYVEAMSKIEKSQVSSRKEAQEILTPYEPDPMTRAFLLTNLDAAAKPLKFQVPLDIIGPSIPDLGGFPYKPGERTWGGSTLFIKGAKSKYINKNNIPLAEAFFPNMSLETLDTGHWVHAEKPNEFKKLVVDFVTQP
ncbi:alpha/beta-hydrolase [Gloeopeniophorella convolvens]|nr:alpha/beta-hydrolase [Gloeopeniophorella convolvens]